MKIRLEEKRDYFEVENLTRESFWNLYRPGCFEHFVLHNMRSNKCFIKELDYVIEEKDRIIANIVYAKGNLKLNDGKIRDILIFGPVSVLPEYQKKGYGKMLIEYTMNLAKELGYSEIVITGNPDYYRRFGFESASKYNIYYEGMDYSDEAAFFMIKILEKDKFNIEFGIYSDPICYKVDEKELDEFDKKFPLKTKEKREGQLV